MTHRKYNFERINNINENNYSKIIYFSLNEDED